MRNHRHQINLAGGAMKLLAVYLLLVSLILLFPGCSRSRTITLITKKGDLEIFNRLEIDSSIFDNPKVTFNTKLGEKEFSKSFRGISRISVLDIEDKIKALQDERREKQEELTKMYPDFRSRVIEADKEYKDVLMRLMTMRDIPIIEVVYESGPETYSGICRDLKGARLIGYNKSGKQIIPFSIVSSVTFH